MTNRANLHSFPVIAGLDPAIHFPSQKILARAMDARIKPAHDAGA
jgi:hypothetical protein